MDEPDQSPERSPAPGHPHRETLPEGSQPQGETALRKGGVETAGSKGGKGGDETHGAGDHDRPNE